MTILTQERLRACLDYNSETGEFFWLAPNPNAHSIAPGQRAGWHNGKNAQRIGIDGKCYLAHRLAWLYVHGVTPLQIDHINGDRRDNRLCNLRSADNSQNQANFGAKTNNRLGIRGVSFCCGAYLVQLRKNGEHFRKRFKTLREAVAFAIETSNRIHGEFSIHNRVVVDPHRGAARYAQAGAAP